MDKSLLGTLLSYSDNDNELAVIEMKSSAIFYILTTVLLKLHINK
jgi:hypothetical protein